MSRNEKGNRGIGERSPVSAAEFNDFLVGQAVKFAKRGHPVGDLTEAFNRFLAIRATRRTALRWGLALGTLAAIDQGPRIPEHIKNEDPKIIFPPTQNELLDKSRNPSKTAVIFFGAATVRDPSGFDAFDKFIPPFNESEFPVGYMRYGKNSLDPRRTAAELRRLKTEHGIENVIGIFQSAGLQFTAEAFDLVREDINLVHGVLDSTPLDASTTRSPFLGELAHAIDPGYDGGWISTAAANISIFGTLSHEGTAGPDLAFDQAVALADGEYLTSLYRPRIQRDGTTFSYLTTDNPDNDQVIDPVASLQGLERVLGVSIKRYGLKGNQHHANAHENAAEYQKVSREIAEEQRKILRERLALAA